ncbi:MAG TPA: hypothetical protein VL990_04470 [Acidobacteriaceae bacterium]|nr:hypothetical protein [Acidobacteriaceae bacterium]
MRLFASSLVFGLALPIAAAQTAPIPRSPLSTAEAAQHVGENRTVCGEIANIYTAASSHGTPTFVDIDQPYPHSLFDLVIWGENKPDIGPFPKSGKICASGKIILYHGRAEIFLQDWHSWYIPNSNEQRASMP